MIWKSLQGHQGLKELMGRAFAHPWGCSSWGRLGVDDIVCLPILQIGGVRVYGWCRRGGGDDSIRCVSPSALSMLLRRYLRRHGEAGRFYRLGVRANGCLRK